MTQPLTKAVLLTGAAARISQEVAILDQLMNRKEPPVNGLPLTLSQDDTLLAGFSSGSLNLAAINACFSTGSSLGWDTYYKQTVLFPLRNKKVFKIDLSLSENMNHAFMEVFKTKLLPLDTSPLRETITEFVKRMHCEKVGDLPFYSYIPTFSLDKLDTYWACNQPDDQFYLDLIDTFMASTAIPFVFPSQEISSKDESKRNFPGGMFADGGTEGTFFNFENYLGKFIEQNGKLETMFVISPMREKAVKEIETVMAVLKKENRLSLDFNRLEQRIKNISMNGFLKFLNKLNDWNKTDPAKVNEIFVCIPVMPKNFCIMNFNDQKRQYAAVIKWFNEHPDQLAIPLQKFIDDHPVEMD